MQPILLIAYFVFFSWLIFQLPFFKNTPLSKWWLVALFALKIGAGFVYGWYFAQAQYVDGADTWNYYNVSLAETAWLQRDPAGFVNDLFHHGYAGSGNLFNNQASYWNDLKSNAFIKLLAVVNVFTAGSYYVNVLVFNFLFLFGPVALYRLAVFYVPQQRIPLLFTVFFLPSFLFWCSGLHKDGLIFSAMMLMVYSLHRQWVLRKVVVWHVVLMLLCAVVLFALRNFVLLLLLPAMAAWYISERHPAKKGKVFGSIYALCVAIFFTAPLLHPALHFPAYVVEKQAEFNALSGNSRVALPPLKPSLASFIMFLPHALDMALLQPHWSNLKNASYLAAAAENALLLLLVAGGAVTFLRYKKISPFTLFLLFFSLSLLLLCGYTVTFVGAVVRYKSIATPLLATAACALLPPIWKRASYKL